MHSYLERNVNEAFNVIGNRCLMLLSMFLGVLYDNQVYWCRKCETNYRPTASHRYTIYHNVVSIMLHHLRGKNSQLKW